MSRTTAVRVLAFLAFLTAVVLLMPAGTAHAACGASLNYSTGSISPGDDCGNGAAAAASLTAYALFNLGVAAWAVTYLGKATASAAKLGIQASAATVNSQAAAASQYAQTQIAALAEPMPPRSDPVQGLAENRAAYELAEAEKTYIDDPKWLGLPAASVPSLPAAAEFRAADAFGSAPEPRFPAAQGGSGGELSRTVFRWAGNLWGPVRQDPKPVPGNMVETSVRAIDHMVKNDVTGEMELPGDESEKGLEAAADKGIDFISDLQTAARQAGQGIADLHAAGQASIGQETPRVPTAAHGNNSGGPIAGLALVTALAASKAIGRTGARRTLRRKAGHVGASRRIATRVLNWIRTKRARG